jgi:hypothetical protein
VQPGAARVSALTTNARIFGSIQDGRIVTGEVEHKHRFVPGEGPVAEISVQELRQALAVSNGELQPVEGGQVANGAATVLIEGEVLSDDDDRATN